MRIPGALVMLVGLWAAFSCSAQKEESPTLQAGDAEIGMERAPTTSAPPVAEVGDDWIGISARKVEPMPKNHRVGPEEVGPYTACMPEEDIRKSPFIRMCPGVDINQVLRCYTLIQPQQQGPYGFELWARKGVLVRAVVLNSDYRSPQRIGVGSSLVELRAAYPNAVYLRGPDQEWVAAVEQLKTHFILDDKGSSEAEAIPHTAKVAKLEVSFSCGD